MISRILAATCRLALPLLLAILLVAPAPGASSKAPPRPSSGGGSKPPSPPPPPPPKPPTPPPAPVSTPRPTFTPNPRPIIRPVVVVPPKPLPTVRIVPFHVDFSLQMAEGGYLRALEPAPKYDDKGVLQKYTPEELKQLRADHPEFPGFPRDLEGLHNGQTIVVYMGKFAEPTKEEIERAKETKGGSATSPDQPKVEEKAPAPRLIPVGALGGTVSGWNETTRDFKLRVESLAYEGHIPVIDSKALVKDLQVLLILIVKD
jgi:hypothetical protein